MTPNIKRALGAQRSATAHLLVYEMRMCGYTASALARKLGCCSQNVQKVINGAGHSSRVIDALREIGVSESLLFDPRRISTPEIGRAS